MENSSRRVLNCFSSRAGLTALVAIVLLAAIGCGPSQKADPNRTTVTGVVTFDGKPLPAGTVYFESTTGNRGKSIMIREGGKYLTDRAPIGPVRVSVETESLLSGTPSAYVKIPAKYADTATSGLTAKIKPGVNENVNFELKSGP